MTSEKGFWSVGVWLGCVLAAAVAGADTVTWQGPLTGGAWNTAANWLCSDNETQRVPTGSDAVVFPSDLAVTDVTIEEGGMLELADGTKSEVGALTFGEKLQYNGTWGASASAAENKDDTHFSGTGVIHVRGGRPRGLIWIVR